MTLWRDLTLAARFLRRSPAFTAAAVLTLALGIGANATVFSLADATLFRNLAVPDAERIVHIFERRTDAQPYPLSYADYRDYRDRVQNYDALAAHYPTSPMHVLFDGEPMSLTGAVVTATYFDVLQLQAAAGRFFNAQEDLVPDRDAVVVISDTLWSRQYGRDRSALGRLIKINGRAFTVIGVMRAGFVGVHPRGIQTDLWIPTAMFTTGYRFCNAFERSCAIVQLIGRLRRGTSIAQAQSELDTIAIQLASVHPSSSTRRTVVVPARGLGYGSLDEERRQMRLFLAAVGVVLLIACANIAGLLLARTATRRREIAVRLALGAGRWRIVRQLMTESALLAVLGGGAGLLLAIWGNDIVNSFYAHDSAGRPLDFRPGMSAAVVAAAGLITALSTVLFGAVPALLASRATASGALKSEGVSGARERVRLRQALVSAQVALSVMLLIGAALLVHSLREIYKGPGFNPDGVLVLRLRPSLIDYAPDRALAYQASVIARLESVPGVVSASPSSYMLVTGAGVRVRARRDDSAADATTNAIAGHVGPRYFETLGVPLVEGREFGTQDRPQGQKGAIINEVLAKQLWPEGFVTGRTIRLEDEPYVIAGVVRDAQYYASGEVPRGQVFFNYWQTGAGDAFLKDARVHVRVSGNAHAALAHLKREIAAIDPSVPINEEYVLTDRLAFAYQSVRIARAVIVALGVLSLCLSAIGLYGGTRVHGHATDARDRAACGAWRRAQSRRGARRP